MEEKPSHQCQTADCRRKNMQPVADRCVECVGNLEIEPTLVHVRWYDRRRPLAEQQTCLRRHATPSDALWCPKNPFLDEYSLVVAEAAGCSHHLATSEEIRNWR